MGCATGLVKYLVFLANVIFALAGLALVIIGVMYKFNSEATRVLPSDFGLAPILSIVIGAIVFITASLGCCGAVKESTCMLTTYAIILLTIFIIQVAIGIYAFLQIKDPNDYRRIIRKGLQDTFDHRYDNHEANETIQLTQRWLKCCGVDGPDDWNARVPPSCCENTQRDCSSVSPALHHDGCANAMFNFLQSGSKVVGGAAIGIALIEVIGAVFGLCLASSIRNHNRRNIYA